MEATTRPDADAQLVKVLGAGTIAANAINLTVASGIFVLPAVVAGLIGPAGALAYLVCGAAMALVLLCFCDLGSTTTRSGGGYAYIDAAFGPFAGFLAGTLLWFAFGVLSDAAIAAAFVDTLASVWSPLKAPLMRAAVLALFFGSLVGINIVGAKAGARFAVTMTIVKLVPLAVFIVAALPAVHLDALTWSGPPTLSKLGETSLVLFFAFTGAETALSPSGEIKNPRRTVPLGLMAGAAGVIVIYLLVHLVAQGVLGPDLAKNEAAPLVAAAQKAMGDWGRVLLLVGASLSMFGAVAGDVLSSPRALFATASDGLLPSPLAKVHPRFRTPYVAIAVYGGLACAFAMTGGFRALAALSSAGLLLVYLAVCVAALRKRIKSPGDTSGFRAPGGLLVPLLACALVIGLLSNAARSDVIALSVLLGGAALYYLLRRRLRVAKDKLAAGAP